MGYEVYISGVGCLSSCGLSITEMFAGLRGRPGFTGVARLGKSDREVRFGMLPDFSDILAGFVKPLKRRKLSRLSRMAVTVSGLALQNAGLEKASFGCGVVLGTAFGSTSQSELFYTDMLSHGFVKANPGLFPETVPNSPAGQVSITCGLHGANTTICQQSLSSELALMTACDFIDDGKLDQVVVIGLEEMSSGLLSGLWSCGGLQKGVLSGGDIPLRKKMVVGEGAVALILESALSLQNRQGVPLAQLTAVSSGGGARWPAAYHDITGSVERVAGSMNSQNIDCVIPSASFIRNVDDSHFSSLAALLPEDLPMLIPEYHTGALFGAGLLKQALAVEILQHDTFTARKLGSEIVMNYDTLYPDSFSQVSSVYTSAVSAGGGCGATIIQRVV